jgi:hypothetical protein
MKNTHVLPTDKPSRLGYLTKKGKEVYKDLRLFDRLMPNILDSENQNIYITSDEEIKEGDWFVVELFKITGESDGLHIEKCTKLDDVWCNNFNVTYTRHKDNCKKIILTTDQDLIKDGVQAIDDEFLEWYVQNPSCEEIEVKHFGTCCGNQLIAQCINCKQYNPIYKIIIPKEEPNPFELPKTLPDDVFYESLEPKQETLEEAAEKHSELQAGTFTPTHKTTYKHGFEDGAKWQSERMYSKEEVEQIITQLMSTPPKKWFEQLKK